MTDEELNLIERRWNLVVGQWQESEGERTASEVGPLVCQDVPRLFAEVKRLRLRLKRTANLWTERSETLRLGGYDERAGVYDRCIEDVGRVVRGDQ